MFQLLLSHLLFFAGVTQADEFVVGNYQYINDENCAVTDVDGFITKECNGPVEGVRVILYTGGDWDSMSIVLGSSVFDLSEQIYATGGFSGFGNPRGIIEWVGVKGGPGFIVPTGLIVRFDGLQMNEKGVHEKWVSQLAVYGINDRSMCFKGFVSGKNENARARELARVGECQEDLIADEQVSPQ